MVIKNTTICNKNVYKQAAMVINSKDESYRKKKLVLNFVGLLSGISAVGIMSRQIISTGDYNMFLMLPFLVVCAACLFMGMYYLDRNKYNQIQQSYAAKGIQSIDFEIDAEDITMISVGKSYVCKWTNITKWMEDVNNFYLFIKDVDKDNELITGDCIIINKKGFTQCSAKDMKQLCDAIMQERKSAGN